MENDKGFDKILADTTDFTVLANMYVHLEDTDKRRAIEFHWYKRIGLPLSLLYNILLIMTFNFNKED